MIVRLESRSNSTCLSRQTLQIIKKVKRLTEIAEAHPQGKVLHYHLLDNHQGSLCRAGSRTTFCFLPGSERDMLVHDKNLVCPCCNLSTPCPSWPPRIGLTRVPSVDEGVLVIAECVGSIAVEALVLEEVGPQRSLPSLLAPASGIARITGAEGVALVGFEAGASSSFLNVSDRFLDRFADGQAFRRRRATRRPVRRRRRTTPRRGSRHSSSVRRLVAPRVDFRRRANVGGWSPVASLAGRSERPSAVPVASGGVCKRVEHFVQARTALADLVEDDVRPLEQEFLVELPHAFAELPSG